MLPARSETAYPIRFSPRSTPRMGPRLDITPTLATRTKPLSPERPPPARTHLAGAERQLSRAAPSASPRRGLRALLARSVAGEAQSSGIYGVFSIQLAATYWLFGGCRSLPGRCSRRGPRKATGRQIGSRRNRSGPRMHAHRPPSNPVWRAASTPINGTPSKTAQGRCLMR